jgi:hypothetical protein
MVRSMRSSSISKTTNNEKLGRNIFHIESHSYLTGTELSSAIESGTVVGQDITTELMYSDNLVHGFCGDKIVSNRNDFEKDAKHIIETLLDDESVSIVVDTAEKQTQ